MARPKEFDKEEALEKAMNVFWCRGYEATSMQELVDAMGIKRQSLYDTFGDKHQLYLRALDRYRSEQETQLLALLNAPGQIKEKLRKIFDEIIKDSINDNTRRGCFMNNAMAEMTARDAQTAERAVSNMNNFEKTLEKALRLAQKNGEITEAHDATALARYFFNALNGLRVVAKTSSDKRVLEDIVKVTLAAFD